jgi:hypothetical protein
MPLPRRSALTPAVETRPRAMPIVWEIRRRAARGSVGLGMLVEHDGRFRAPVRPARSALMAESGCVPSGQESLVRSRPGRIGMRAEDPLW